MSHEARAGAGESVAIVTGATRGIGLALGVGVHVVCPDVVDTSIFDRALDTASYSYRQTISRHLGRAISAEDAARHTLAGVRKGRAVIYTPPRSRTLGTFGRLFPSFVARQVAARMAPPVAAAERAVEGRSE